MIYKNSLSIQGVDQSALLLVPGTAMMTYHLPGDSS